MQPLLGLVVVGGRSARMGTDKSLLNYHGQPQRNYLYRLLEPCCEKTFIACNREQVSDIEKEFSFITDNYEQIGPMAALLSAFDAYPGYSFMMVGCDYPFFNTEDIVRLLSSRKEAQTAIAYYNVAVDVYEPLLCIYEAAFAAITREQYDQQQYSLQKVLQQARAGKLYPNEIQSIRSIDTVNDYQQALEELKKQQGSSMDKRNI